LKQEPSLSIFILIRDQENNYNKLIMNHPNAVGNEDYTGFYDSDLGQSVVYGFKKIYIPEIFGEVERFLLKNEKNRNVYVDIKKGTYSYFDGSQINNERMDTYLENIVKPRYKRMHEIFKGYQREIILNSSK